MTDSGQAKRVEADERTLGLVSHFKGGKEGGPVRAFVSELAAQGTAATETCVGGEDPQEQAGARGRLPGLYEACALAEAFDETYVRQAEAVRRAMVHTFDEPYAMEHSGDVHARALAQTVEEREREINQNPRNRGLLLETLDGLRAAYDEEFGSEPSADAPASSSSG